MSETLVERMARAMCESDCCNWGARDFTETGAGEEPEEQRDGYRDKALAALRAIREPTTAMQNRWRKPDIGTAYWIHGIDAAIAEAEHKP